MTLDIGQLIEDAELVQQSIDGKLGWSAELEAIDRIIAYFRARYVPPSEPGSYRDARGIFAWREGDEPAEESIRRMRDDDRPEPPEPTPSEYPPGYMRK